MDQAAMAAMARPAISPEQAAALALNKLEATAGGYVLNHLRHSVTFQAGGMRFKPQRGGPEWRYQLTYVGTGTKTLNTVESGAVQPKLTSAGIVAYLRGSITEQYVMLKGSIE